jgi:hypothetical protein
VYGLEDHHLVLYSDLIADRCAVLSESAITGVAVAANASTSEKVRECPDPGSMPNVFAFA